jgi:integrase
VRLLARSFLAPMHLTDVRGADVARYRDERLTVLSASSVRLELAIVSNLFEIARREWGLEDIKNPVKAIRKPKAPRGRSRRPTLEKLEAIRAHCSWRLWAVIRFAVETAMRRGEIASLTWDRVDMTRRIAALDETKNGEPRVVPLSSRAVEILKELRENAAMTSGPQEHAACPSGPVFSLQTADAISTGFYRACRAAGIEGLRFHDLRHEGVSRFFERGLAIADVAAISGHKTWTMLRRYTHLSAEALAVKLG